MHLSGHIRSDPRPEGCATSRHPTLLFAPPRIDESRAQIGTSLRVIRPAGPDLPHPSNAEIAEFMESLGFDRLSRSYYGWQRKHDGVTILDARADNFIKSREGVVPIDLVISHGKAAAFSGLSY